MASGFFHLVLWSRTSRLNPTKTRHRSDAMRQRDSENDDASLYCYPPNRGSAAIRPAEGAHDAYVATATSSGDAALNVLPHGEDDSAGTGAAANGLGALTTSELTADGSVEFDGQDFAWIHQWMEDGSDAAGFWAAPGEAGPLTGGIWGTPIGGETLSAGETLADGVVAVGEAIAADQPASMSDLAQTDATEVDMEGENLAAVGGSSSFAESMNLGKWSLSYD
jgi:hypothetical protein